MGKKSKVYSEVLNGYLALRDEQRTVESRAKASIEDAQNNIEINTAKMKEAVSSGDQNTYVQLSSENDRLKGTIAFFKEVLEKLKKDQEVSINEKADMLYREADAEIVRIKSEYANEMTKALKPIIEMSNDVLLQVELLELAKNKILRDIEHKPDKFRIQWNYNEYPMMRGLDQMLQHPDCVEKMKSGSVVIDPITHMTLVASRNNWDITSKSRFSEEAAKWV